MPIRLDPARRREPLRLAILGLGGRHARANIVPLLARYADRIQVKGFDLRMPLDASPFPFEVIRGPADLHEQFRRWKPDVVHDLSWHSAHVANAEAALDAGVSLVLCEKPVAANATEANAWRHRVSVSGLRHRVFYIDAYRMLPPFLNLTKIFDTIGEFVDMQVSLLEAMPITPDQIAVHATGMGSFLYHTPACLAYFFDLTRGLVREAAWARHDSAPAEIPDTYRAAIVSAVGGRTPVLSAEVGKYARETTKRLIIRGSRACLSIDRLHGVARIQDRAGNVTPFLTWSPGASNYTHLLDWLADGGEAPKFLLDIDTAVAIDSLIDVAHSLSRRIDVPDRPRFATE